MRRWRPIWKAASPTWPTLRRLIRAGTLKMAFVPVLCGSAFKNKGVQPMLNAVIDYLPGPLDVPPYMGFRPGDETETRNVARSAGDDQPFTALAFKIMNDPFMGSLTFTRIYSGTLSKGDSILNSTKGKRERIGRMVMMHANKQEEITEAYSGDIIALAGLKETTTGDTLCDPADPVVLETMQFPTPVIEIAIEPKTKNDQEKMAMGLARLAAEDPSFQVYTDPESGQTIMRGMGELHLEILVDRLRREFKVEANIGQPQVAYRETISHQAEVDYTHKKQTGGSGQFARVKLVVEPAEPGEGFSFTSEIVGGVVPKEYIPGVEKGVKSVLDSGPLAGFPVIDVKVRLVDGAYHDVDSSVLAFEIAARAAMREGLKKAGAEAAGADHEGRGGDARGVHRRHDRRPEPAAGARSSVRRAGPMPIVINAFVPLANMFGYARAPALDDLGAGAVHHAVRSLRAGAGEPVGRDPGEVRLTRPRPAVADERRKKANG
ncbi:MAG: hypothetical protein KatS3mg118_0983 [Paracoccaceae bacterium]|nr:MAG: hypothetical protein KatS3mg118_0983 [Paracoccaceae bacterium]